MSRGTKTFNPVGILYNNGQLASLLLGKKEGVDFNSDADQLIQINNADKYVIRRILVTNATVDLDTAVGGIYTASTKGGSTVVAATQVYTGLSSIDKFLDLTLDTLALGSVLTDDTLYFSLTTAQGEPATADIYIFGDVLN